MPQALMWAGSTALVPNPGTAQLLILLGLQQEQGCSWWLLPLQEVTGAPDNPLHGLWKRSREEGR